VSQAVIRAAAGAADWAAVRELCCLTGQAGAPIEAARWAFFAELWIGPYQRVRPAWTRVAVVDGRVVGYLTGCPDSRRFRLACGLSWSPTLLARVLLGAYGRTPDTRRFVRRALGLTRPIEADVARRLPRLDVEYPAHLHMNVAARCRGQGIGRRLVERFVADLGAHGVPGVHLLCGEEARGFYGRLGFDDLARLELRSGATVHALGRRLDG
jgi:GNAT superfamily N-acetyltransferase